MSTPHDRPRSRSVSSGVLFALAVLATCFAPARSFAQHQGHTPPPTTHETHAPAPETSGTHEMHDSQFSAPTGPASVSITDADRAAAFPDLGGMTAQDHMDTRPGWFLLLDQLEWRDANAGDALAWDVAGWIGGDFDRLWLRAEGEREDGRTTDNEVQLLYGRAVARWWDFVAGVRQDFEPGPLRSWAAIGVQGLAPYQFEVEATAYLGESGRTALRLEAQYELRLTNRWMLKPLLEVDLYSKDDPGRGIGSGLSQTEVGLRLRYEIRREFAPYVGVAWQHSFGETADLTRASGDRVEETRFVAGLRIWF